jgi:hypothetical protein
MAAEVQRFAVSGLIGEIGVSELDDHQACIGVGQSAKEESSSCTPNEPSVFISE